MTIFKQEILQHPVFYIAKFAKNTTFPYLIFIHGGPGFNSNMVEYLIENEGLFNKLNFNIILYDQREVGKSKKLNKSKVVHSDNLDDLKEIYHYITEFHKINVKGMIGHSYGAKLLFDFQIKFHLNIPSIFVATANSILIPRLNNLALDLAYLKKTDQTLHKKILSEMDNLDLNTLCKITEELSHIFQQNKDRYLFYWANLDWYKRIESIDPKINNQVFTSVRKDLYSNSDNFSINIDDLQIKKLWINGFHDFIMNGYSDAFLLPPNKHVFLKSSHFPHIEENELFCEVINDFLKSE